MVWLWYVLGGMSLLAFCLYGVDKRRTKRGQWRISEKTLLAVGIFGGAVGALLGMRVFHHKTKHWYFYAINTIALILHAALAGWLLLRG